MLLLGYGIYVAITKALEVNERCTFSVLRKLLPNGFQFAKKCYSPINTWMTIEFDKHWDYYLWRGGFLYKTKLLREEQDLDEVTQFHANHNPKRLYAIVRTDELGLFFECLEPFLKRTEFQRLDIRSCSRKTMQTFSEFLVNKLNYISIDNRIRRKCGRRRLALYLDFVKRAKPEIVQFSNELLTKRCLEWLLHLSGIVQSLIINVRIAMESEFDLVTIIQNFLFRKCKNIQIHFTGNGDLTLTDTEQLIQILHKTDKKVTISSWTDAEPMNVQIGVYLINAFDDALGSRILIKHLQMD